jgi:photosystem II stability/assembly factor-like uncharacterized protein
MRRGVALSAAAIILISSECPLHAASPEQPPPAERALGLPTRPVQKEPHVAATSSAPAEPRPAPEIVPALPPEWVDQFHWRCIGPATMGGRITAIAVCQQDHSVWWAGTASGGLLKTNNNGSTFEYQFEHEAVASIGDVAVAPSDPNIVWVGTGENNPRNSVSWGNGVYKSTDGGSTWQHMGLEHSFQIGRIAIHPTDPNVVYVGALGRLWGHNEERGLYKTVDGGQTWSKVLYIDDKTGVIDVCIQPQNPEVLLVASYERRRDRYDSNDPAKKFGPGSGLYKSTDGGASWRKITAGLPSVNLGRIGIDFYEKEPNVAYLVLESERIGQQPRNAPYLGAGGEDADVGARLTEILSGSPAEKAGLRVGDIVVSVDGATVQSYADLGAQVRRFLAGEDAQLEVSRDHKSVFAEVTFAPQPLPLGARPEDPPFSAGLGGQRENMQEQQGPQGYEYGGIYRSDDAGETWTRINSVNPRPMYFSQVRVDPSDNHYLWVLGIDLYRSNDGGATFTSDGGRHAHPDHHSLWIDPSDGRHMVLGNDGGIYVTYDRGDNWEYLNNVAIGQFYHVSVDSRRNYRVYGGLQDNGTWGGPSRSASARGPVNGDWSLIGWGDGFVCRVDTEDPDQVYFESQNGGMGRYHFGTGRRGWIGPVPQEGMTYRFNWKTPFLLSQHNSRILYAAGNYVFRSLNRGDALRRISPEIVRTDDGAATTLAESPQDSDILYVGTDDGWLWITRDGGRQWQRLVDFPTEKTAWKHIATQARQVWTRICDIVARPGPATRPASAGAESVQSGAAPRLLQELLQLDLNHNGRIERDEVPPRLLRIFGQFDQNHDGLVDETEMRAVGEDFSTRSPSGEVPPPAASQAAATQPVPAPELQRGAQAKGPAVALCSRPAPAQHTQFAPDTLMCAFTSLWLPSSPGQAARDGCLTALLPGPRRVSCIEVSQATPGRLYVTFDGHRSDDDEPYVFTSEDYGQTWRSLRANLPTAAGPVHVIREDPENADLLYLGTEFGAWVSIDRGESWTSLRANLPTVAVHEFAIHPTSGEIVAATHGRSLWILDVATLRQISKATISESAVLYRPNNAIYWRPDLPRGGSGGACAYRGENPPDGAQVYYSLGEKPGYLRLEIANVAGQTIRELAADSEPGLHMARWDLRAAPETPEQQGRRVPVGRYLVKLSVDRRILTQELVIESDPEHPDYAP